MKITEWFCDLLDWLNPVGYECNTVITRILHVLFFFPISAVCMILACVMMFVAPVEAFLGYIIKGKDF